MSDAENNELEDLGGSSTSANASVNEYKKRFDGANRKISEHEKTIAALEKQLDDAKSEAVRVKSDLRLAQGEVTTVKSTFEKQLEQLTGQNADLSKTLSRLNADKETRKTLASKEEWKPLLELQDKEVLRPATDFAKPEDYAAYLDTMVAWRGQPAPQTPAKPNPAGAVPPTPTSTRSSPETLTQEQIYAEIDRLDARIPEQKKRLDALYPLVQVE